MITRFLAALLVALPTGGPALAADGGVPAPGRPAAPGIRLVTPPMRPHLQQAPPGAPPVTAVRPVTRPGQSVAPSPRGLRVPSLRAGKAGAAAGPSAKPGTAVGGAPPSAPAAKKAAKAPPPAKTEKAERVFRPTLDRKKGHVGDVFTYTLRIVHDPGERYLVPAEPDFGPFTRKGREFFRRTLEGGRIEETFLFRLTIYKTGVHRIPTLEIPFVSLDGKTHRAVAQDVDVTIESLLPNGKGIPPLKEVKAPVPVRVRDWRLLYAGAVVLGLLLLAGLGWLGYRYGKRIAARPKPAPPPPPPRPAHLIAFEKLARVSLPTTAEELKLFYEQVSGIVREYYGNRYGFLALDMTTEELLAALRGRQERGLVLSEVTAFLSEGDLVKFAKFFPDVEAPQRYLDEARRLVEATRVVDAPPEQQVEAA